jgi:hypothetical protein
MDERIYKIITNIISKKKLYLNQFNLTKTNHQKKKKLRLCTSIQIMVTYTCNNNDTRWSWILYFLNWHNYIMTPNYLFKFCITHQPNKIQKHVYICPYIQYNKWRYTTHVWLWLLLVKLKINNQGYVTGIPTEWFSPVNYISEYR